MLWIDQLYFAWVALGILLPGALVGLDALVAGFVSGAVGADSCGSS